MKKQPLISVIVPIYNLQDYIEKSLTSIWQQTYPNLEVICVNDGSTDKSLSVLQKIAGQHDNMQIIDKENGGVSSARNIGLQVAQGEYIYFFDGDDFAHPQMLEIMQQEMEKFKVDIADCDIISTSSLDDFTKVDAQKINTVVYETPLQQFLKQEKIFPYSSCTKLYKSSFIKNYHFLEEVHYGEDMLFNLILFSKVHKVVKVKEPFYVYMERSTSCVNTSFNDKKAQSFICLIREIHKQFINNSDYSLIKKNISGPSAKFLIKKIVNTSIQETYIPDIIALYKLGAFGMESLGWKNCVRLLYWILRRG